MEFRHRRDAGRMLGERLAHTVTEQPVVVALPRSGVPVGYEVARILGAPFDVLAGGRLAVPVDVGGRTVVIVDDGTATALAVIATAHTARELGAERIVIAVPGATRATVARLDVEVDEVVALEVTDTAADSSFAFTDPVTDEEAQGLLARARAQNTADFQAITLRG